MWCLRGYYFKMAPGTVKKAIVKLERFYWQSENRKQADMFVRIIMLHGTQYFPII